MRIKKNDKVRVVAGNDRGKEGKVLKVFPGSGRIIVEKVNMIKRHTRASKDVPQGGIIEKEGPINASNVMLVCPNTGKPTRIGKDVLSDGSRARVSKKSGENVDVSLGRVGSSDDDGAEVRDATGDDTEDLERGELRTIQIPLQDEDGRQSMLTIEYYE